MVRPATEGDAEAIARDQPLRPGNTVVTFWYSGIDAGWRGASWRVARAPFLAGGRARRAVVSYLRDEWHDAQRIASREHGLSLTRHRRQRPSHRPLRSAARGCRRELHVVIGGIALPNRESVALHEKLGMKKVAHFHEVGFKLGRWIDVGYWQKVLEPSRDHGAVEV
jgi:phosphinothricin acetyltransferase